MKKFKKGDRVHVVMEDGDISFVGMTGTIVETDRGLRWPFRVRFDTAGKDGTLERLYRPEELELISTSGIPEGAKPIRCVASRDGLGVFVWSDGVVRATTGSQTLEIPLEEMEQAVEKARTARETFKKDDYRREAIEFLGIDGTYDEMTDYQKNRVDSVIEIKYGGYV